MNRIKVNMHQAKTHLSEYIASLEKGNVIILCKRNVPVAEIRPIPHEEKGSRPIGLAKGTFEIPDSFFEPLPDDVIQSFYTN